MKILITTFSFPSEELGHYDGKFVLAEAKAYAKNGATVKVLTPYYPGSRKKEQLQEGIEIIRFPYFFPNSLHRLKQPGKPIYDSKSFLALLQIPLLLLQFTFQILRFSRWADIIHSQWTVTALLSLPAKFLFRTPIVTTARGSDLRLMPKWLNRFIHRSVTSCINCWGPQPQMMSFQQQFPANYIKLPLIVDYHPTTNIPYDIQQILEDPEDIKCIFFVGRLVKLKIEQNRIVIDLIEAVNKIRIPIKFHVFIIGNGEKDIVTLIKEKIQLDKISNTVSLLGGKTNVCDYMRWADLGIGGQALNAVSQEFITASVPQVFTKGDPNTEAIWTHNHNAFLINPSHPEELASLISNVLMEPELRHKVAQHATQDMAQYVTGLEQGGKQYLQAFKELCENSI